MYTQFITLTTTDAYDKIHVVAVPVGNIALMEEYNNGTIITLVNGGSLDGNKIIVNEFIETILAKIECEDDDDEDWDEDEDEE